MTKKPFVLIIDDEDHEGFAVVLSQYGVDALHVTPDTISTYEMNRADLVLIDEFLAVWHAREAVKDQPGLFVRDGIALSGVLRASLEGRGPTMDQFPRVSRTAIVLRTGHLDVLAIGTPAFLRPMTVASRHDLEWVVEKETASPESLAALAFAVSSLPETWDPSAPDSQLEWLGLGHTDWRDKALAQIEQCRPPWSVLAATSAGRRWLAWFLQKILPFPTFLVDDARAAAFLGLTSEGLQSLADGSSDVAQDLCSCEYRGQLSAFAGRRWWRAGIAALRQSVLDGIDGRLTSDVAARLIELNGASLDTLNISNPVFPIDGDYRTLAVPIDIDDAVRVQPDEWPTFADTPWLATKEIEFEPDLAKLVVLQDRSDVSSGIASDN